jgi:hypothetical protein
MTPSSFGKHTAPPARWRLATASRSEQFAPEEWHHLCRLRLRYRQARDYFTDWELEQLRFLRWLYRTGRLQP